MNYGKNHIGSVPITMISAALLALIVFISPPKPLHAALLFTETINTLPEGAIEFSLQYDRIEADEPFGRERFSFGFGMLPKLSVWYSVHYLQRGGAAEERQLGDSFLKFWYYCGDFFSDRFHCGISTVLRLPTGPDAYADPRWRAVAFGNSELVAGPVAQIDISRVYIHLNYFYAFRAAAGEDFFGGLSLNPGNRESYRRWFGFNPSGEENFLYKDRLKNDYMVFSCALNSDYGYPVLPWIGVHAVHRVYRRTVEADEIPLEGAGINPVFLHGGARYFLTYYTFVSLHGAWCLNGSSDYIRGIAGLNFSLQF